MAFGVSETPTNIGACGSEFHDVPYLCRLTFFDTLFSLLDNGIKEENALIESFHELKIQVEESQEKIDEGLEVRAKHRIHLYHTLVLLRVTDHSKGQANVGCHGNGTGKRKEGEDHETCIH